MSRHHLTGIWSFLSRPWGLIRLGVWGFILILQPKNGERYSPSLPTFYSYFLAISKRKLKCQLPNMPGNHVQKIQHSITAAESNMHRDPFGLHKALCTMILSRT